MSRVRIPRNDGFVRGRLAAHHPVARDTSRAGDLGDRVSRTPICRCGATRMRPGLAVSGLGQPSPRRSRPRAPGPRPLPRGAVARARRTGRDRPTRPASARWGSLRGRARARRPRRVGTQHPPRGVRSAGASGPRSRCRRDTRAVPPTKTRARHAMRERDRRASPSPPPDALRARYRCRSCGWGLRHPRLRVGALHRLDGERPPRSPCRELSGTTLVQRGVRPEHRPDDRGPAVSRRPASRARRWSSRPLESSCSTRRLWATCRRDRGAPRR